MYSYEDRIKAIEFYIKSDLSLADTVRVLGYPNKRMLRRWYREYQVTGALHEKYSRHPNYSLEQKASAVDYYLERGRSIALTIRAVGYPSRETLKGWIDELAFGERKASIKRGGVIQFTYERKKEAVIELCAREGSAAAVANRLGTSRYSLYKWKKELLGEEGVNTISEPVKPTLPDDRMRF